MHSDFSLFGRNFPEIRIGRESTIYQFCNPEYLKNWQKQGVKIGVIRI